MLYEEMIREMRSTRRDKVEVRRKTLVRDVVAMMEQAEKLMDLAFLIIGANIKSSH
jgi:hypothetical protein